MFYYVSEVHHFGLSGYEPTVFVYFEFTLSMVDIERYVELHTAIRITEIFVPTLVLEENIYKV